MVKAKKKAAPKGKAAKKKATKKASADRPSIRATIIELMSSKGLDKVTYEETERIAKKLKKDTKWQKTHFYYYRKIVRAMLETKPKKAAAKKKAAKKKKRS